MRINSGFDDNGFDVEVLSDGDFDFVSGGQTSTHNTVSTETACYTDGITDYSDPQ